VSGPRLVDGAGHALFLRGVNVSGTEFSCIQKGGPTRRGWSIYGDQPLDSPAPFSAMQAWHINVVRIPLNEDCWIGINGVDPAYGGDAYRAAIRMEVQRIHDARMYAILDLHWTSPGPYAAMAQQPLPDADHSAAFWQSVASTFIDDPAVIFDLFNEPNFDGGVAVRSGDDPWGWVCWRDGCPMRSFNSNGQTGPDGRPMSDWTPYVWQSAGMQHLIDAVRSTGAKQPVIVNGVAWANDATGVLTAHDRLGQMIVGLHSYPGQGCRLPDCWPTLAPLAARAPLLIGETGDSKNGPVTYLNIALPFADDHLISYLAWTWNPWSNPDDVLITAWNGAPTQGEGKFFRDHLLAVAPRD
jgi:hypothetical protein